MSEERKVLSEAPCAPGDEAKAAGESTSIEVVDLGRASERTRGQLTGFIVEPSSFPLREL